MSIFLGGSELAMSGRAKVVDNRLRKKCKRGHDTTAIGALRKHGKYTECVKCEAVTLSKRRAANGSKSK